MASMARGSLHYGVTLQQTHVGWLALGLPSRLPLRPYTWDDDDNDDDDDDDDEDLQSADIYYPCWNYIYILSMLDIPSIHIYYPCWNRRRTTLLKNEEGKREEEKKRKNGGGGGGGERRGGLEGRPRGYLVGQQSIKIKTRLIK